MSHGSRVVVREELSPDGVEPLYVLFLDGKKLVRSGKKSFVTGLALDLDEGIIRTSSRDWYYREIEDEVT